MADKIDGICMKITPQKEVVLWLLSHVIRLIYLRNHPGTLSFFPSRGRAIVLTDAVLPI